MASDKPHMNLAVIGHIDHGKSTTVGRMMFETGAVPAHIIEGYRKEAESKGKATFEFAWVMDNLKEERERGITIDIALWKFETPKYYVTVIGKLPCCNQSAAAADTLQTPPVTVISSRT